jgi:hypothetical protein
MGIIHLASFQPYCINHPNNTRQPITEAARSEAWTVFGRSNIGIVGSKPTQAMDVCVCLFCVCLV